MSRFKPEPLEIQGKTHFDEFCFVYGLRRSYPVFASMGIQAR